MAYWCVLINVIGAFLSGPGAMEEAISKQSKLYAMFKEEQVQKGFKAPHGDGVLVFDEVKVVSRLMWNSRNQQMIGLAMSPEDMSSLHDIYMAYDEEAKTEQTTYILQFLWRDLTSKFDIVGPYFTSSKSVKAKFTVACVFETIKLFQLYGFETSGIVCDGASTNLTTIKCTSVGHTGAYGSNSSQNGYPIPAPCFENPFNPPHLIHWIVCPSHQVNNKSVIIIILFYYNKHNLVEEHD